MHVLVTGGAGYVGSATVRALLAGGHEVTVVDDLRAGSAAAVPDGVELVALTLADTDGVEAVLRKHRPDACVHFAASIEAGFSMREPEAFFANNTAVTLRLLESLVRADVGTFVFSSTAAVYGEPRANPIDEDHPLDPTNAYGESKLLVERALGWLGRRGRISSAALRYFNAAGAVGALPERHDPETHLIPVALDAAAGRRPPLALFGTDYPTPDGTTVRDYVHVADLASAHVLALDHLAGRPVGEAFAANLGSGTGFSVRQVLAAVERIAGLPVPYEEAPRRAGDPAVLVASNARARALLGWQPRLTDLDRIVEDAWAARRPN